jgi:hypothetical protein
VKITQKRLSSSCVKCRYAKEKDDLVKKIYGAVKEKKKTMELPYKEILCKDLSYEKSNARSSYTENLVQDRLLGKSLVRLSSEVKKYYKYQFL